MPEKIVTISRRLAEMKVEEIMNRRPRTVKPDTTITGLIERMLGEIDACFPVVDKDLNLLGIVTESDI
ncbi:MAG: CBS domain-containing protein, partial [Candidatus Hadarchaeales archaeon]